MLSDEQLQAKIELLEKNFEDIFGEKLSNEMLQSVLRDELHKRQVAVVYNRLCQQRPDRDVVALLNLVTPATAKAAPKVKKTLDGTKGS